MATAVLARPAAPQGQVAELDRSRTVRLGRRKLRRAIPARPVRADGRAAARRAKLSIAGSAPRTRVWKPATHGQPVSIAVDCSRLRSAARLHLGIRPQHTADRMQGCFKIWRRVSEGHTSAHTW